MLDIITLTLLIALLVGLVLKSVSEDVGCALMFAFGAALLLILGGAAGIFLLGWSILPW